MLHNRLRAFALVALALACCSTVSKRGCADLQSPPSPRRPADVDTCQGGPRLSIVGDMVVKPGRMGRLSVVGAPADASLDWDVSPHDTADVEEVEDRLLLTGQPGRYVVTVRVLTVDGKRVRTKKVRAVVHIEGPSCAPEKPAPPSPPAPPGPGPGRKADPVAATGQLFTGDAYCTATPVWPRRADGRWNLACAAHCLKGYGADGIVTFPDGRKVSVVCTAHRGKHGAAVAPDLAILTTVRDDLADLPFVYLAKDVPEVGTEVWQNGYGVTTKRKVMRGKVASVLDAGGMLRFDLIVSKGDSGGGIYEAKTGYMVATVCCTPKGGGVFCWGGACTVLWEMWPKESSLPISVPDSPPPPRCPPCPLPSAVPGELVPAFLPVEVAELPGAGEAVPWVPDHPAIREARDRAYTQGLKEGGSVGLVLLVLLRLLELHLGRRSAPPPPSPPTPHPLPKPSDN